MGSKGLGVDRTLVLCAGFIGLQWTDWSVGENSHRISEGSGEADDGTQREPKRFNGISGGKEINRVEKEDKLVYVPMAADTVHPGHLNIIKVAAGLGQVMVGLFTDEAIASYKKVPVMDYEKRKQVIESIKGVDCVVRQDTRDYESNLRTYKPDYMVHGTDWREGPLATVREKAIRVMEEWGGKVVEPEYTEGISSSGLHIKMEGNGKTSQEKAAYFKRLTAVRDFITVAGVFSAQGAGKAGIAEGKAEDGIKLGFDALWLDTGGLAQWKGKKDSLYLDLSDYLEVLTEIGMETEKPVIVPMFCPPSGPGLREKAMFRLLEQAGISAVVAIGAEKEEGRMLVSRLKEWRKEESMVIWGQAEVCRENMGEILKECVKAGAEGMFCHYSHNFFVPEDFPFKDIPVLVSVAGETIPNREILKEAGFRGVLLKEDINRAIKQSVEEALEQMLQRIR